MGVWDVGWQVGTRPKEDALVFEGLLDSQSMRLMQSVYEQGKGQPQWGKYCCRVGSWLFESQSSVQDMMGYQYPIS